MAILAHEVGRGPRGSDHATPLGLRERVPGERLTMADGSVWFHPYDGSAPFREQPPKWLAEET